MPTKQQESNMPKKWNHTESFKHFGTKPANVRWSWSACAADGKTVVATLWQDQFKRRDGKVVYIGSLKQDNRLGAREMMRNLAWAWIQCQRRFNVIVAVPKDAKDRRRAIKECFPSKMVMRLTQLDLQTGAYAAETEAD